MIIAKNDEEKRSKIWRWVTIIASVVIVVVAVYFLIALFAGNPLEGTWKSRESVMELTIHKGGNATVFWKEMGETSNVKLNLRFTIEKEDKMIAFELDEQEIKKTVKATDGAITEEAILTEVGVLENTFDYSLNHGVLTLSEREYGEQIVFEKE